MFKSDEYIQNLISLQTIPSLNDLKLLVEYLHKRGLAKEDISSELDSFQWRFSLPYVNKVSLVELLIKKEGVNIYTNAELRNVRVYETELRYLKTIEDDIVRRILFLFLIVSKWNHHSSGWIKYDRAFFFSFWDLSKISQTMQKEIISKCCEKGLELRVLGSKNPIVCFKVNFMFVDNYPIMNFNNPEDIKIKYNNLFKEHYSE